MAILFALFAMVSFTACSSDDDDTPSSDDIKKNIVGTWELTHIKGWVLDPADNEEKTHVEVDKSLEDSEKERFVFKADGSLEIYDHEMGYWEKGGEFTSYELTNNELIVKGPYKTLRINIKSLKGNTMVCTVKLYDEGDTEYTFIRKE